MWQWYWQFWSQDKGGYRMFTNMVITRLRERDDIWSEKVRWLSKMKARFRAESVVQSEQLWILASCCWRPMRWNSVLQEFNVNRLAVIQEDKKKKNSPNLYAADMCCRAFWRWVTDELKSGGQKNRKSCLSSSYRWWFKERYEIRVLTDVYMLKSRVHTHTHTHTLFKNTQQTCRNKMQMTITKEKNYNIYIKKCNMKRHQLMNERLKTLELHCGRTYSCNCCF